VTATQNDGAERRSAERENPPRSAYSCERNDRGGGFSLPTRRYGPEPYAEYSESDCKARLSGLQEQPHLLDLPAQSMSLSNSSKVGYGWL
jgi:hypothetical protein